MLSQRVLDEISSASGPADSHLGFVIPSSRSAGASLVCQLQRGSRVPCHWAITRHYRKAEVSLNPRHKPLDGLHHWYHWDFAQVIYLHHTGVLTTLFSSCITNPMSCVNCINLKHWYKTGLLTDTHFREWFHYLSRSRPVYKAHRADKKRVIRWKNIFTLVLLN